MKDFSFNLINRTSPRIRAVFLRPWYEYISRLDKKGDVVFMNYGYSSSTLADLRLNPKDEINRYSIQLYEKLVSGQVLAGKSVLEIGSGRGGGAAYLAGYHKPERYIGVDLTRGAIKFAAKHHIHPNLEFMIGDAQRLEFEDASFDLVLNLESSHCYPDFKAFVQECYRVLTPGGKFAFADWRRAEDVSQVGDMLNATGFVTLEYEDIGEGILEAIDKDHGRKLRLIQQHAPAFLRGTFAEFSGLKDSRAFDQAFRNGDRIYFRYLLEKS